VTNTATCFMETPITLDVSLTGRNNFVVASL